MSIGDTHIEGVNPGGDDLCQFRLSKNLAEKVRKDGPGHKFFELQLVLETLQRPKVIFEGLERESFQASFCYVSKPDRRYSNDGECWPPVPGRVFLVYVRDDLRVLDWEWHPAAVHDPDIPDDTENRFGREKWRA